MFEVTLYSVHPYGEGCSVMGDLQIPHTDLGREGNRLVVLKTRYSNMYIAEKSGLITKEKDLGTTGCAEKCPNPIYLCYLC